MFKKIFLFLKSIRCVLSKTKVTQLRSCVLHDVFKSYLLFLKVIRRRRCVLKLTHLRRCFPNDVSWTKHRVTNLRRCVPHVVPKNYLMFLKLTWRFLNKTKNIWGFQKLLTLNTASSMSFSKQNKSYSPGALRSACCF